MEYEHSTSLSPSQPLDRNSSMMKSAWNDDLVCGWPTPLKKKWVPQLGWWLFPMYGKNMFQTTNQWFTIRETNIPMDKYHFEWESSQFWWLFSICQLTRGYLHGWNAVFFFHPLPIPIIYRMYWSHHRIFQSWMILYSIRLDIHYRFLKL